MNFGEFETVFRDAGIRSWISWDILDSLGCEITEVYTRSIEVLGSFYTVWYTSPDGGNGDWRSPQDSPLTVSETLKAAGGWPNDRKRRVAAFQDAFSQQREPIQLVLPAYAPNDRDTILLDGTHRAVAAYIAKVDVRLLVFIVQGPCSPAVLPDLQHYSG
jgi:hypothetical protein